MTDQANEVLRAALQDAKVTIREQAETINRLTSGPLMLGTVVSVYKTKRQKSEDSQKRHRATIAVDGRRVSVELPAASPPLAVGDTVELLAETLQIVGAVDSPTGGDIATVSGILNEDSSEVAIQGSTRLVQNGKNRGKVRVGDRVIVDPSGSVVINNLGRSGAGDISFFVTDKTGVTWDDIGGLGDAKEALIEAVEMPIRHADHYRFYKKPSLKGILLFGPPGCGKTMLGRAAATSLAALHAGRGADTAFMYMKGPEILNSFVGNTEATIRRIFSVAREHHGAHGYSPVVFIDEADAILGRRGSGISSDVERTTVPMFLAEMHGFDKVGPVIILATNRPDTLDPAVVRDGRVDRRISVPRPDRSATMDIFHLHLDGIPLADGLSRENISSFATDSVFDPARSLYDLHLRNKTTATFTLGHLSSGALVSGIVGRATTYALKRDVNSKRMAGMVEDDIARAVDAAFREMSLLANHDDDLRDFADGLFVGVDRVERKLIMSQEVKA